MDDGRHFTDMTEARLRDRLRDASLRITRWAYRQVEDREGLVWVSGRTPVPLGEGWREVLRMEGSAG